MPQTAVDADVKKQRELLAHIRQHVLATDHGVTHDTVDAAAEEAFAVCRDAPLTKSHVDCFVSFVADCAEHQRFPTNVREDEFIEGIDPGRINILIKWREHDSDEIMQWRGRVDPETLPDCLADSEPAIPVSLFRDISKDFDIEGECTVPSETHDLCVLANPATRNRSTQAIVYYALIAMYDTRERQDQTVNAPAKYFVNRPSIEVSGHWNTSELGANCVMTPPSSAAPSRARSFASASEVDADTFTASEADAAAEATARANEKNCLRRHIVARGNDG